MGTYKITFGNGDTIVTRMNGTIEDARRYYQGNKFNLGTVNDDMQICISVEEVRSNA